MEIDEKLDYILGLLNQNRSSTKIPLPVDDLCNKLGLANHEEFKELMRIMVDDKVVELTNTHLPDLEPFKLAQITARGVIFFREGGYRAQGLLEKAEKLTDMKLRVSQQKQADRLERIQKINLALTVILALTAGVVCYIELVKFVREYYYPLFPCLKCIEVM